MLQAYAGELQMTEVVFHVTITINGVIFSENSWHTIYEKYNGHNFMKTRFRQFMSIGMKITDWHFDINYNLYVVNFALDVIL